jgi:hypothetical protein
MCPEKQERIGEDKKSNFGKLLKNLGKIIIVPVTLPWLFYKSLRSEPHHEKKQKLSTKHNEEQESEESLSKKLIPTKSSYTRPSSYDESQKKNAPSSAMQSKTFSEEDKIMEENNELFSKPYSLNTDKNSYEIGIDDASLLNDALRNEELSINQWAKVLGVPSLVFKDFAEQSGLINEYKKTFTLQELANVAAKYGFDRLAFRTKVSFTDSVKNWFMNSLGIRYLTSNSWECKELLKKMIELRKRILEMGSGYKLSGKGEVELQEYQRIYRYLQESMIGSMVMVKAMSDKGLANKKIREFLNKYGNVPYKAWSHGVHQDIFFKEVSFTQLVGFYYLAGYDVLSHMNLSQEKLREKYSQYKNGIDTLLSKFLEGSGISQSTDIEDWVEDTLVKRREDVIAVGLAGLASLTSSDGNENLKEKMKEIYAEKEKLFGIYMNALENAVRGTKLEKKLVKIMDDPKKRFDMEIFMLFDFSHLVMVPKNRRAKRDALIKMLAYQHAMSLGAMYGKSKTARRLTNFFFNTLIANGNLEHLIEHGGDENIMNRLIYLSQLDAKKPEFKKAYAQLVEEISKETLLSLGINLDAVDDEQEKREYIAAAMFLPYSLLEENKQNMKQIASKMRGIAQDVFGITGSEIIGMILNGTSPEDIIKKSQKNLAHSKIGLLLKEKGYSDDQIPYIVQDIYPHFLYFFLHNAFANEDDFINVVKQYFPDKKDVFLGLGKQFSQKKLLINLNTNPSLVAATAVNTFATMYYNTKEAKKFVEQMDYTLRFNNEKEAQDFAKWIGCGTIEGNALRISFMDYETKIAPYVEALKQSYALYIRKHPDEVQPEEILSILGGIFRAWQKAEESGQHIPLDLRRIGEVSLSSNNMNPTLGKGAKEQFLSYVCNELKLTRPGKKKEYHGFILEVEPHKRRRYAGERAWILQLREGPQPFLVSWMTSGPFTQMLNARIRYVDSGEIARLKKLRKNKVLNDFLNECKHYAQNVQDWNNIDTNMLYLFVSYHGSKHIRDRARYSANTYFFVRRFLMKEYGDKSWEDIKKDIIQTYGENSIIAQLSKVVDDRAKDLGISESKDKLKFLAALISLPAGVIKNEGADGFIRTMQEVCAANITHIKRIADRSKIDGESIGEVLLFMATGGKYHGPFIRAENVEQLGEISLSAFLRKLEEPSKQGKSVLDSVLTTLENNHVIKNNEVTLIISHGTPQNPTKPILVHIVKEGKKWKIEEDVSKVFGNETIPLTSTLAIVDGHKSWEDMEKETNIGVTAYGDVLYALSYINYDKYKDHILGVFNRKSAILDPCKIWGVNYVGDKNKEFYWTVNESEPPKPIEVTPPNVIVKKVPGVVHVTVPMILPPQPNLPFFVPPIIVNQTQYVTEVRKWVEASIAAEQPGAGTIPAFSTLDLLSNFGVNTQGISPTSQQQVRSTFFDWATGKAGTYSLPQQNDFMTHLGQKEFYVYPDDQNKPIIVDEMPTNTNNYFHFKLDSADGNTYTYAVYEKVNNRDWLIGYVDYTYVENENVIAQTRPAGKIITHSLIWEEFNKMLWFGYLFGNPITFNVSGGFSPQIYTYYKGNKKIPSKFVALVPSVYVSPMAHTTIRLPLLGKEMLVSAGLPTYFSIGGGPILVPYAGLGTRLLSGDSASVNVSVGGSLYKTHSSWNVLPQYNMDLSVKMGEKTYLTVGPDYVTSGIFGFHLGIRHVTPEGAKGMSITCYPSISYLPVDVTVNGVSMHKLVGKTMRTLLDGLGFDKPHSAFEKR